MVLESKSDIGYNIMVVDRSITKRSSPCHVLFLINFMPKIITDFIHRLFDFVDTCKGTASNVNENISEELVDMTMGLETIEQMAKDLDDIKTDDEKVIDELSRAKHDILNAVSELQSLTIRISSQLDELDEITDEKDFDEKGFELLCLKENITL